MILATHTGLLGQERSGRLMEYLDGFFLHFSCNRQHPRNCDVSFS